MKDDYFKFNIEKKLTDVDLTSIYPFAIDISDPSCIKVGDIYVACLLCTNFPYSVHNGFLDDLSNMDSGTEISIIYEPQNKIDMLKDITQTIGYTKYKINEGGDNQIDSAVQESALTHALKIKSRLSSGDDLWYMSIIIRISSKSKNGLIEKLRRAEGILLGQGITSSPASYRQLETFITSLPLSKKDDKIINGTRRNILTSGLPSTYLFKSSEINDPEGVFVGTSERDGSPIILDPFDTSRYTNANMLIFGGSGSGKTTTTQMITARFRMQKIPVLMICPFKAHEYENLCKAVGGQFLRFSAGGSLRINILGIRPTLNIENKNTSHLASWIITVKSWLSLICDLSNVESQLFEKALIELYSDFGITFDNASLYVSSTTDPKYLNLRQELKRMPVLSDLDHKLKDLPELYNVRIQMTPFVSGTMQFLNGETNVDLDNLYVVSDISQIEDRYLPSMMLLVFSFYMGIMKADVTRKTLMVVDEFWRCMTTKESATYILEAVKIVRGYAGSVLLATQDITDTLSLDESYGRRILNNCQQKIILQTEIIEARILQEAIGLTDEEVKRITTVKRPGKGLICAGARHAEINIMPFNAERRLTTTDLKERIALENEN